MEKSFVIVDLAGQESFSEKDTQSSKYINSSIEFESALSTFLVNAKLQVKKGMQVITGTLKSSQNINVELAKYLCSSNVVFIFTGSLTDSRTAHTITYVFDSKFYSAFQFY